MIRLRTWGLIAVLGLAGCLRLPHAGDVESGKQAPLSPLASPPPKITAALVNRNNGHEISEALNHEIENDLYGRTVTSPPVTPSKGK